MDNEDVKKIRKILRSATYEKIVTDPVTYKKKKVTDCLPISIEFDNALALSEKTDIVMWDDTNNIVWGIGFNNDVVKGSDYMQGSEKVLNPGCLYAVDYGEIQQFRMEINEQCFNQFMQTFKNMGVKVNYNGKEVVLNDNAIKNAKRFIVDSVDPLTVIKKNPKFMYK